MSNIWLEELPLQCPPKKSFIFTGSLYRLVDTVPPTISDFYSKRKLFPKNVFGIDECIARACSVYDNKHDCQKQKKYPSLRNKKIIRISFQKDFGVVQNTFSPSHYSWWILQTFSIKNCKFEAINDKT